MRGFLAAGLSNLTRDKMKLHDILSSELPDIDDSVKECVNLGEWLLFKSEGSTFSSSSFF